ncbi:hypothetical protein EYF80_047524 [Liparis tanakae]|uniref:Uncharacterized protein n=1 Tax=Liparis tanakae TaxID=230148 RepID=A0A4Z2FMR7_9TELE|nr:hypothetical protein EYF80_047524 [Liparis tanakae]
MKEQWVAGLIPVGSSQCLKAAQGLLTNKSTPAAECTGRGEESLAPLDGNLTAPMRVGGKTLKASSEHRYVTVRR